jgi:predicted DNA-binding transcriptional regulator AlpA
LWQEHGGHSDARNVMPEITLDYPLFSPNFAEMANLTENFVCDPISAEALMDGRRWLNAKDAAAYLGMKTATFLQKCRDGVVPTGSAALGPRLIRWHVDALDAFMAGDSPASGRPSTEDIVRAIEGMAKRRPRRPTIDEAMDRYVALERAEPRRRRLAGLPFGHVPDK